MPLRKRPDLVLELVNRLLRGNSVETLARQLGLDPNVGQLELSFSTFDLKSQKLKPMGHVHNPGLFPVERDAELSENLCRPSQNLFGFGSSSTRLTSPRIRMETPPMTWSVKSRQWLPIVAMGGARLRSSITADVSNMPAPERRFAARPTRRAALEWALLHSLCKRQSCSGIILARSNSTLARPYRWLLRLSAIKLMAWRESPAPTSRRSNDAHKQ